MAVKIRNESYASGTKCMFDFVRFVSSVAEFFESLFRLTYVGPDLIYVLF